jgi:hypothetical protein
MSQALAMRSTCTWARVTHTLPRNDFEPRSPVGDSPASSSWSARFERAQQRVDLLASVRLEEVDGFDRLQPLALARSLGEDLARL